MIPCYYKIVQLKCLGDTEGLQFLSRLGQDMLSTQQPQACDLMRGLVVGSFPHYNVIYEICAKSSCPSLSCCSVTYSYICYICFLFINPHWQHLFLCFMMFPLPNLTRP